MISMELRIGTRGSQLALFQVSWVKEKLVQAHPRLKVTLIKIKTTGDKIQDAPLAKIGRKGLFVKEIEEALIQKRIDFAVHSIKDVPIELPEGLYLPVITKREDPRDVFISKEGIGLKDLPRGARIGTSSLRRQVQLLHFRDDFAMIPLRGNLDTRLKKLSSLQLDGIILASAGLRRMCWEARVSEYFDPAIMLPAIGQGVLAVEGRRGDERVDQVVAPLNHLRTQISVLAERAFLKRLGGGCQVPVAGLARVEGEKVILVGLVAGVDGKKIVKGKAEGTVEKNEELGERLAEELLARGAGAILREVYKRE